MVAEALKLVQEEGERLGLKLKLSKCELILTTGEPSAGLSALFPQDLLFDERGQDRVLRDGNFEFLGAPIGSADFCAKITEQRVEEAATTITAICTHGDPQIGLRLLWTCGSFCKLVYSTRVVAPHAQIAELQNFDALVRQTFSDLTGLHPDDATWDQATRGFDSAGLGLRSTADHGVGAYLASRAASRDRCKKIDDHFVWDFDDPGSSLARAYAALGNVLGPAHTITPDSLLHYRQKTISAMIDKSKFERQFAAASVSQRANLNSETLPGASGFLSAIPSKTLGLAMEPAVFVTEIQSRLWLPLYPRDQYCPCCDAVLDTHGNHARLCMAAGDVVACHNAVRNKTGRFCASAGHAPSLERPGLLPPRPDDPSNSNLRRPADVFLPAWTHGSPAALDFAIVSPQRQDVLAQSAERAGAAASAYEAFKRRRLNTAEECAQQGVEFIPLVAESSCGWGFHSLNTIWRIAKSAAEKNAGDADLTLGQFLQSLCITIRSAKARAVLRRAGHAHDLLTSAVESAAVALASTA